MKNKIRVLIISIFSLYILGGVSLFFFQSSFIYFPNNQNFNNCPGFDNALKINWNGTRMYVKKNSNNWLVFYHGNAGSACDRAFLKPEFEKFGYSYIFVEYGGYSNDPQTPSEDLLTQDAKNVDEYLTNQKAAKIVVMGESLGTSVAIFSAQYLNSTEIILISPFNNLVAEASQAMPFYPVKFMLKDHYQSDIWIKALQNVTIIHGTDDKTIPIVLSKKLYQNINSEQKNFIEIGGAGHNDIYKFQGTIGTIDNLLK